MTRTARRLGLLLLPAALLAGPARAAPPPKEARAAEDPPWTVGPPAPGEPAWKAAFRTAYAPADGQAVKLVPGPFPAARADFVFSPSGKVAVLTPERRAAIDKDLLGLIWDGRRLRLRTLYAGGYGWGTEQGRRGLEKRLYGKRLGDLVEDNFRVTPPLAEIDDSLWKAELYADVVVREGAALKQIAADLGPQLREKFELPVAVAAREEEREVVVAKGKYVHTPRRGVLNCVVDISAEPLPEGDESYRVVGQNAGGGIDVLFRRLGTHIDRPVIDETDAASWQFKMTGKDQSTWIGYMGCRWPRRGPSDTRPADGSGDRAAVLKRVAAQTGLTFATEKRKVWVLSVKAAE